MANKEHCSYKTPHSNPDFSGEMLLFFRLLLRLLFFSPFHTHIHSSQAAEVEEFPGGLEPRKLISYRMSFSTLDMGLFERVIWWIPPSLSFMPEHTASSASHSEQYGPCKPSWAWIINAPRKTTEEEWDSEQEREGSYTQQTWCKHFVAV